MLVIENIGIDLESILARLKELNASKVIVQSPLGLRMVAKRLGEILAAKGFNVIFSGSSCWGGCDVAYGEASEAKADAIIHLGHSRFLRSDKIPTVYVECRYVDGSPLKNLATEIAEELRRFKAVGLGGSVQWLDHLYIVSDTLKKIGLAVYSGKPSMYAQYEGQVLGCDISSLKSIENMVEAFIVVGSVFHALGLALLTSKPTFAADPHTQKVKELSEVKSRILRQRYINIQLFKDVKNVAVIVSVKPGQKRLGLAYKIDKLLKNYGKNSFVLMADEITPNTILENRFEGFVNTACPRLSIEDHVQFSKPVLLPSETMVALGLLKWEEVVEGGLLMYPWGWAEKNMAERFWNSLKAVVM